MILPAVSRERLLSVAMRTPSHVVDLADAFHSAQPAVSPVFMMIAESMAEGLVHPALVYGIAISAITTFYIALTEEIEADKTNAPNC